MTEIVIGPPRRYGPLQGSLPARSGRPDRRWNRFLEGSVANRHP
jgi:hypothetical protein